VLENMEFERFLALFAACRRQVSHAVAEGDDGDIGLGHVACAIILEGYLNLHAKEQLPESVLDSFQKLSAAARWRLLPRLLARDKVKIDTYERSALHERAQEIFTERNKVAHGNVRKWSPAHAPRRRLREFWNDALSLIVELEIVGGFRLPRARFEDFKAEVDLARLREA
jgi:hypothetical protein